MPIVLHQPSGKRIQFPDGMPSEQIASEMYRFDAQFNQQRQRAEGQARIAASLDDTENVLGNDPGTGLPAKGFRYNLGPSIESPPPALGDVTGAAQAIKDAGHGQYLQGLVGFSTRTLASMQRGANYAAGLVSDAEQPFGDPDETSRLAAFYEQAAHEADPGMVAGTKRMLGEATLPVAATLATAPFGAVAAAGAGILGTAGASSERALNEAEQAQLSPKAATGYVAADAAIYTILGAVSGPVMAIPIFKQAVNTGVKQAVREMAKRTGGQIGLQELAFAADSVRRYVSGVDPNALNPKQLAQGAFQSAIVAAAMQAPGEAIGAGRAGVRQAVRDVNDAAGGFAQQFRGAGGDGVIRDTPQNRADINAIVRREQGIPEQLAAPPKQLPPPQPDVVAARAAKGSDLTAREVIAITGGNERTARKVRDAVNKAATAPAVDTATLDAKIADYTAMAERMSSTSKLDALGELQALLRQRRGEPVLSLPERAALPAGHPDKLTPAQAAAEMVRSGIPVAQAKAAIMAERTPRQVAPDDDVTADVVRAWTEAKGAHPHGMYGNENPKVASTAQKLFESRVSGIPWSTALERATAGKPKAPAPQAVAPEIAPADVPEPPRMNIMPRGGAPDTRLRMMPRQQVQEPIPPPEMTYQQLGMAMKEALAAKDEARRKVLLKEFEKRNEQGDKLPRVPPGTAARAAAATRQEMPPPPEIPAAMTKQQGPTPYEVGYQRGQQGRGAPNQKHQAKKLMDEMGWTVAQYNEFRRGTKDGFQPNAEAQQRSARQAEQFRQQQEYDQSPEGIAENEAWIAERDRVEMEEARAEAYRNTLSPEERVTAGVDDHYDRHAVLKDALDALGHKRQHTSGSSDYYEINGKRIRVSNHDSPYDKLYGTPDIEVNSSAEARGDAQLDLAGKTPEQIRQVAERIVAKATGKPVKSLARQQGEPLAGRTPMQATSAEIAKRAAMLEETKPPAGAESSPTEAKGPQAAKQPWEMTREEYQAKGLRLAEDDPRHVADVEATTRYEAARGAVLATEPKLRNKTLAERKSVLGAAIHETTRSQSGLPGALEAALASPRTPKAVKEEFHAAKAAMDALPSAAEIHKQDVAAALRRGDPVPPEVLADYPDLRPPSSPPEPRKFSVYMHSGGRKKTRGKDFETAQWGPPHSKVFDTLEEAQQHVRDTWGKNYYLAIAGQIREIGPGGRVLNTHKFSASKKEKRLPQEFAGFPDVPDVAMSRPASPPPVSTEAKSGTMPPGYRATKDLDGTWMLEKDGEVVDLGLKTKRDAVDQARKRGSDPANPERGAVIRPSTVAKAAGKGTAHFINRWFTSHQGAPRILRDAAERGVGERAMHAYMAASIEARGSMALRKAGDSASMLAALQGDQQAMLRLAPEAQAAVKEMRDHLNALQDEYASSFAKDPKQEAMIRKSIGEWTRRSYDIFEAPNIDAWIAEKRKTPEWNRVVRQDVARKNIPYRQAEGELVQAMRDYHEIGDFAIAQDGLHGRLGKQDLSSLKQRKDLSADFRFLMGEIKDPMRTYARSVDKLASMVSGGRFQRDVYDAGIKAGWLSAKADPNMHEIVPEGVQNMGPLAKTYATPEVARIINEGLRKPAQWNKALRTLNRASQATKWLKTVGNVPISIFRQVPQGIQMVIQTGINPLHLKQAGRALKHAGVHVAHGTDTGVRITGPGSEAYIRKMVALDLFNTEVTVGSQIKAYEKGGPVTTSNRAALKTVRGMNRAYQTADNAVKAYVFEGLKAQYKTYMDSVKMSDTPDRWGISDQDRFIARKVVDYVPNVLRQSPAMQFVQHVPLVNPFINYTVQTLRSQTNVVRDMLSELGSRNRHLTAIGAKKAAGLLAVNAGLGYGAQAGSKWLFGVSDEEESQLRKAGTQWTENTPTAFGPATGPEGEGERYKTDLNYSAASPVLQSLVLAAVNAPAGEKRRAMLKAIAQQFLGQNMLVDPVSIFMTGRKWSTGRSVEPERAEGMESAGYRGAAIAKTFLPQLVNTGLRGVAAATGVPYGKADAKLTPATEILSAAGMPTEVVQPLKDIQFDARTWDDGWSQSYKNAIESGIKPKDAIRMVNERRMAEFNKVATRIQQMKESGIAAGKIIRSLRDAGLSKDRVKALMSGRYPRWMPEGSGSRSGITTLPKMPGY